MVRKFENKGKYNEISGKQRRQRGRWLDGKEFTDLVAACSFILVFSPLILVLSKNCWDKIDRKFKGLQKRSRMKCKKN